MHEVVLEAVRHGLQRLRRNVPAAPPTTLQPCGDDLRQRRPDYTRSARARWSSANRREVGCHIRQAESPPLNRSGKRIATETA
jgi:hypothetical protein